MHNSGKRSEVRSPAGKVFFVIHLSGPRPWGANVLIRSRTAVISVFYYLRCRMAGQMDAIGGVMLVSWERLEMIIERGQFSRGIGGLGEKATVAGGV